MWDELVCQGKREPCRFGEDFKRLKNLVERSAVLRKDGGEKEREGIAGWRVKVGE